MILGIGNDIIEIKRIEKSILKDLFLKKVYTEKELENIKKRGNRAESYAGVFSAKEAISKALGTGFRNFSLIDIEILNNENGKPIAVLSEKIKDQFGDVKIEIAISHCKEYAVATAFASL